MKSENGYTLPYVLLISVIISTLLLSLIGIFFFNNLMAIRKLNKKNIELSCYSAVQREMKDINYIEGKSGIVQVNGIDVFIKTELNGFYYSITASGKKSNDSAKIKYTFSYKPEEEFENAVIFSRPNLRASVAGTTKIHGDILATSSNFTRGNIYGIQGTAVDFINGEIKVENNIPGKLYLDTLFKICKMKKISGSEIVEEIDGKFTPDKLIGFNTNKHYVISGDLVLDGEYFKNRHNNSDITFYVKGKTKITTNTKTNYNISIYSDSSVFIENNCSIQNLFIYAAKDIEVKNDCIFENGQLLSERNIYISGSLFNYPSVIASYVNVSKPANLQNKISIESSVVNGTIALVSSTIGLSSKAKILIDEKSRIQGLVYSENLAEIKGKIDGILYVYNLYYYKEPTEYINWMVNLQVDRKKLDKWFLLPMGFVKSGKWEILREERIY